jgi:hypothetical protein
VHFFLKRINELNHMLTSNIAGVGKTVMTYVKNILVVLMRG